MSRSRRSTIGSNPLDAIVPLRLAGGEATTGAAPAVADRSSRQVKERFTVQLQPRLADRIRDAVYWTPGLTVAGLAEQAFEAALHDLEAGRGGPFPPRHGDLPPGRPIA